MNKKASTWQTENYKLQVYLPANLKAALDRYAKEEFSGGSRVVSAIVRNALSEYLKKAGYLGSQGGEDEIEHH